MNSGEPEALTKISHLMFRSDYKLKYRLAIVVNKVHKTQDEDKQNKNRTQYALDTTLCKQTQITLIRLAPFLQTTWGKDEPNIVFMRKS